MDSLRRGGRGLDIVARWPCDSLSRAASAVTPTPGGPWGKGPLPESHGQGGGAPWPRDSGILSPCPFIRGRLRSSGGRGPPHPRPQGRPVIPPDASVSYLSVADALILVAHPWIRDMARTKEASKIAERFFMIHLSMVKGTTF